MKRRTLLSLGALTPLALFTARYGSARASTASLRLDYRERARQLHALAENVQTPADARSLVDFIAELFSNDAPSAWMTGSLRNRIAQAEFHAVTDVHKQIPETSLAAAWNAYVETVQAPAEHRVTPTEIHNLRDAFLASSRLSWDRGIENIWAVPSIYATQPDGMLAPGCRAVESIRILWDLANMPGNLKAARERVGKGTLASELLPQALKQPPAPPAARVSVVQGWNPMEIAERQYIEANGTRAFHRVVLAMLDTVFA